MPCPFLWHSLSILVFYSAQCFPLVYQQYLQKTHHFFNMPRAKLYIPKPINPFFGSFFDVSTISPGCFFDVSTISQKKSSSFNIFSTSVIIFIKCRNRHHMKNHIIYKGNINNTSIIIFLMELLALFWWLFSLGQVYFVRRLSYPKMSDVMEIVGVPNRYKQEEMVLWQRCVQDFEFSKS